MAALQLSKAKRIKQWHSQWHVTFLDFVRSDFVPSPMSSLVSWGTRDVNEELNVRIHGSKGAENPFCPFSTTCRAGSWCIEARHSNHLMFTMVSRMWHRSYTICSYMLALCNSRPKFLLPQLNGVVPLGVKSSLSMSMLLAFFCLSAVIRNSSSMKHWSPSPLY